MTLVTGLPELSWKMAVKQMLLLFVSATCCKTFQWIINSIIIITFFLYYLHQER